MPELYAGLDGNKEVRDKAVTGVYSVGTFSDQGNGYQRGLRCVLGGEGPSPVPLQEDSLTELLYPKDCNKAVRYLSQGVRARDSV